MADPLVSLEDVTVRFRLGRRVLTAVDDVSLSVERGTTVGLVGESGSGKSTLGLTMVRAHQPDKGRIIFDDKDITTLTEKELRPFRRRAQMIFQDPYASLDPQMKVRSVLSEPLRVHRIARGPAIAQRVGELLQAVGLPLSTADRFPAEFSGGQRQRISVARALALNPDLLIADEPVSALDVSIQAQVIKLLYEIKHDFGLTIVMIAHDLALVYQFTDRVAVMYLGQIVEEGPTVDLVYRPQHPYTVSLLSATPIPDPVRERQREKIVLRGDPPSALTPPSGCRFHTRCPIAEPICAEQAPPLQEVAEGHRAACHFPGKLQSDLVIGSRPTR